MSLYRETQLRVGKNYSHLNKNICQTSKFDAHFFLKFSYIRENKKIKIAIDVITTLRVRPSKKKHWTNNASCLVGKGHVTPLLSCDSEMVRHVVTLSRQYDRLAQTTTGLIISLRPCIVTACFFMTSQINYYSMLTHDDTTYWCWMIYDVTSTLVYYNASLWLHKKIHFEILNW